VSGGNGPPEERLIINTRDTKDIREITTEEVDLVSGGSAGDVVVANLLIAIAIQQERVRKLTER
jgi:hypothetical protein